MVESVPVVVEMKCAKQPFAKGCCHCSFRAQEFVANGIATPVVHKVSLSTKSKDFTHQRYVDDDISCQVAVIYLAKVTCSLYVCLV